MKPINLAKALSSFDTRWDPKIIAELNGQVCHLRRVCPIVGQRFRA